MKIRPGLLFDAPTIKDFQLKMALETENMKLDPATVEKGVQKIFDHPETGKYYVAEENNKVIGCLLTLPEWSDWRNGTVIWIHSVYVLPEHRGRGIYKALYLHVQEEVKNSLDLRGIRLYVDKTNIVAQKVYEKLGMNGEHYHLYEWMKG